MVNVGIRSVAAITRRGKVIKEKGDMSRKMLPEVS